jgi:hypothetical protein
MCRLHPETFSKEDDVMHPAQNKRSRVECPSSPFDAGKKLGEIDKTLLSFHDTIRSHNRVKPEKSVFVTL